MHLLSSLQNLPLLELQRVGLHPYSYWQARAFELRFADICLTVEADLKKWNDRFYLSLWLNGAASACGGDRKPFDLGSSAGSTISGVWYVRHLVRGAQQPVQDVLAIRLSDGSALLLQPSGWTRSAKREAPNGVWVSAEKCSGSDIQTLITDSFQAATAEERLPEIKLGDW